MQTMLVTKERVLQELQTLEPNKWAEVLDFISFLRHRPAAGKHSPAHSQELTASDLLKSDLVGLWADRQDIDDSLEFARKLRES